MLEQPPKNTMITTPPAKKEFHFAATAEYFAEVVLASTIQEAEAIYHEVKRLITPTPIGATAAANTDVPAAAPQSTPSIDDSVSS